MNAQKKLAYRQDWMSQFVEVAALIAAAERALVDHCCGASEEVKAQAGGAPRAPTLEEVLGLPVNNNLPYQAWGRRYRIRCDRLAELVSTTVGDLMSDIHEVVREDIVGMASILDLMEMTRRERAIWDAMSATYLAYLPVFQMSEAGQLTDEGLDVFAHPTRSLLAAASAASTATVACKLVAGLDAREE